MIRDMSRLHMTESEAVNDFHSVLERVRQGAEVIIEQDNQAVAIIKTPEFRGRDIDECIAVLKARGSQAVPDEDFARDMQTVINEHREPLDPPSWD
jgi:antitoxin (DNA-binding transcriptional repressor) of toxin-antitoxin stability system